MKKLMVILFAFSCISLNAQSPLDSMNIDFVIVKPGVLKVKPVTFKSSKIEYDSLQFKMDQLLEEFDKTPFPKKKKDKEQMKNEFVKKLDDLALLIRNNISETQAQLDKASDYYILNYKDKSASELYESLLNSLSMIYHNPDMVLSKVENVSIKISAKAVDVRVPITSKNNNDDFITDEYYEFYYNLFFQIKDNRIRINAPSFDCESIYYSDISNNGRYKKVAPPFASSHFNTPYDEVASSFQDYLNNLIYQIIKKSENINNW